MSSKEYANNIARHLAKNALCKFISDWAKYREPPAKGIAKHAFPASIVDLSKDKEGQKRLNGVPINEFWRYIPETDAKKILDHKPYLAQGKCYWPDLWEALGRK